MPPASTTCTRLSGASAIAATCSSQATAAISMPIANQRTRNSARPERQRMTREHARRKRCTALLEEEREVRDDRAAEREQDSELDGQFSIARMPARRFAKRSAASFPYRPACSCA